MLRADALNLAASMSDASPHTNLYVYKKAMATENDSAKWEVTDSFSEVINRVRGSKYYVVSARVS